MKDRGLRAAVRAALFRLVDQEANAKALAAFRVVYSLLGLVLVSQMLRQADFLWLRDDPKHALGTKLLCLALGALGAMCLGVGGRLARLVHFGCISYLVDLLPISCIDYSLYMMAGLWACFLDLNVYWSLDRILASRFAKYPTFLRPPSTARAWPVYLLGCNLGLLIFSAALLKHVDPQWRAGYGLYFTFLLPWIKAPWLSPLLRYRLPFQLMNYAVVVLEYSVLPLFLWRRSRPLSILFTAAFFSGLIFPLRIDPIGYVGLTHCIALSSLVLRRGTAAAPAAQVSSDEGRRTRVATMLVGSLAYMALVFALLHFGEFKQRLINTDGEHFYVRWPLKITPLVAPGFAAPASAAEAFSPHPPADPPKPLVRRLIGRTLLAVGNVTQFINWHTTRLQVNHVFGMADSRGNYLYRIVLVMNDGTTREPFKIFQEDMRPGPYSSGILVGRFIQGSMYDVTFAVDQVTYNHREPDQRYRSLMERTIQFSRSLLPPSEQERVVEARVLVRPILMPTVYEGNVEPWLASTWAVLYSSTRSRGSGRFHMDLEPYPLSYPVVDGWRVTIAP